MNFDQLYNENKLKYIGRTYIKDDSLYMNFSGSGIMLYANTDKLILNVRGTKYNDNNGCPYISILIDDIRYDYAINEELKIITMNLPYGKHYIKILKRTESSVSFVKIEKIIVDDFLKIEKEDKLKIEFYGDSITCGYGSIGDDPLQGFTTSTESFLDSYAYLTTKILNAHYSAVCVSGFPIYKSRWNEGFPIESVADMISICDYSEDLTFDTAIKWDNNKYIPDIVVVNLGTNDCSYYTEGEHWVDELVKIYGSFQNVLKCEEFINKLKPLKNKVKSFLDDLFNLYPNVKVIWATGMIYMDKHVIDMLGEALDEYSNNNLFKFKFTSLDKSKDFGTNWHPGKTMHKDAALELVQFIKDHILGGDI